MKAATATVSTEQVGGFAALTLSEPEGDLVAKFLPALGMVGCSLRHHGEELLAQRAGVDAYAATGSTFGIPLLYPWANRLGGWDYTFDGRRVNLRETGLVRADPDTGLPIHGLAPSAQRWRIVGSGNDAGRAWAECELAFDGDRLLRGFPFPHRARYRAEVGDGTLSVRLTVVPAGGVTVPISFGFHPYFQLPDCRREDLMLELPVRRRSILDSRGIPTGRHELLAPGELSGRLGERTFDDSFDRLDSGPGAHPVFSITGGGRRIGLEYRSGFPVAQLYAPAGKPFVAIEPMTAPVDALRSGEAVRAAAPGRKFSAEFRVSVGEG